MMRGEQHVRRDMRFAGKWAAPFTQCVRDYYFTALHTRGVLEYGELPPDVAGAREQAAAVAKEVQRARRVLRHTARATRPARARRKRTVDLTAPSQTTGSEGARRIATCALTPSRRRPSVSEWSRWACGSHSYWRWATAGRSAHAAPRLPPAQRGEKIKADNLRDFAASSIRKAARRERKIAAQRAVVAANKKAAWAVEVKSLRREIARRKAADRAAALVAAPPI